MYLLLTTNSAVAITLSSKANMLERVTIHCDSSALGPTMSVDEGEALKAPRKIAYVRRECTNTAPAGSWNQEAETLG